MVNKLTDKLANDLKANFYEFFKFFWPLVSSDKLTTSKHIEYICNDLRDLGQYIINREKPPHRWEIFNVPPGSTKSTIVSIMWPTWLLANDSGLFIINTSYSDTLATKFVRKSLDIITNPAFQMLYDVTLSKTTEGYFETNKNGGRFATSTMGTVTGQHANVVINDDPLSVEQSYSKANRDRANRFITETLPDRVRDKSITPFVLVMQRLHEDDPTGFIISKDLDIKHTCLPAELSKKTTNGLEYLYTDGYLCPIRINRTVCINKKKELGSYGYSGQYDQNPTPQGGGKIKGHWFTIVDELPNGLKLDMWIDGAYTKNTTNDPTGFMNIGFLNNTMYVEHAFSDYLEMPELLKKVPEYHTAHNLNHQSIIYIEPKASGKSLKQMLISATKLNAVEIDSYLVAEGKEARANVMSPKAESGRIVFLRGNWNKSVIDQLEGFPIMKHDEYIDILGYAVDKYFMKPKQSYGGATF